MNKVSSKLSKTIDCKRVQNPISSLKLGKIDSIITNCKDLN